MMEPGPRCGRIHVAIIATVVVLSAYAATYVAACSRTAYLFTWGIEPGSAPVNSDYGMNVVCPQGSAVLFVPCAVVESFCRGCWRSVSLCDHRDIVVVEYWGGWHHYEQSCVQPAAAAASNPAPVAGWDVR